MIFERVRTRLVLVLRLNTIFGFQYRASTGLGLQTFKTRLEKKSQVGTPIRRNLQPSKEQFLVDGDKLNHFKQIALDTVFYSRCL